MNDELLIRTADLDDIATIGYLAQQIWPGTYQDILSPEQLRYMMNLIYSPESLQNQIVRDKHHFLIAELNEEPIGFASWGPLPETGVYKLHKLYVHPSTQGKGIGKALIEFIIDQLRSGEIEHTGNAAALRLNVNRYNKAKDFYQKTGFAVIREEDIDIGNNYFMNDYVMERKL